MNGAHRPVPTPPRGLAGIILAPRPPRRREVRELAHQFLASLATGAAMAAWLMTVGVL